MGAPIPGYPPPGYANSDEKTWALIAHFGGIVVGFIAPLVAYLVKGNESETVKRHAVEALNFQITWGVILIITWIIGICTFGFLLFLPVIAWIVVIVFSVIGGLRANEGQLYTYPMTFRVIK